MEYGDGRPIQKWVAVPVSLSHATRMGSIPELLVLIALSASPQATSTTVSLFEGYNRELASFGGVYFRGGVLSSRDDPAAFIEARLDSVEARLGRRLQNPIEVVLVPDFGEFSRVVVAVTERAPSKHILGVAFPGRRWIVVREDHRDSGLTPWQAPETTLTHELAHLLVRRDPATRVPRWFDEGVAMWVSQRTIPTSEEARLSGYARVGGLFSTAELRRSFPQSHALGMLAYQQSLLMVSYLVERHSEASVVGLLDRLESGKIFGDAYLDLTGEPWGEFDQGFRSWLSGKYSVMAVLAAYIHVWTIITLFVVVAIVVEGFRRRRARRRLFARESDDTDTRWKESSEHL